MSSEDQNDPVYLGSWSDADALDPVHQYPPFIDPTYQGSDLPPEFTAYYDAFLSGGDHVGGALNISISDSAHAPPHVLAEYHHQASTTTYNHHFENTEVANHGSPQIDMLNGTHVIPSCNLCDTLLSQATKHSTGRRDVSRVQGYPDCPISYLGISPLNTDKVVYYYSTAVSCGWENCGGHFCRQAYPSGAAFSKAINDHTVEHAEDMLRSRACQWENCKTKASSDRRGCFRHLATHMDLWHLCLHCGSAATRFDNLLPTCRTVKGLPRTCRASDARLARGLEEARIRFEGYDPSIKEYMEFAESVANRR